MSKNFGEKMAAGDKVVVQTWAYALSTDYVLNSAFFMDPGAHGTIERVVGMNAVIVRYNNGAVAPIHPAYVYPEGR